MIFAYIGTGLLGAVLIFTAIYTLVKHQPPTGGNVTCVIFFVAVGFGLVNAAFGNPYEIKLPGGGGISGKEREMIAQLQTESSAIAQKVNTLASEQTKIKYSVGSFYASLVPSENSQPASVQVPQPGLSGGSLKVWHPEKLEDAVKGWDYMGKLPEATTNRP